jgi:Mn2+/Fe2+ NRAMP family transporter
LTFNPFKIFISKKGLGAAFLMATSAIGPGFLTQTTVFTQQLLASMGFVIICSVVIDIVAQLNIWEILISRKKKASELANEVLPNSGHVLTLLICFGGLAFNIGNIAGAGLGLNVLFQLPVELGAGISALIAVLLFLAKDAATAIDWFVKLLGGVMVALVIYVAFSSQPPVTEMLYRTIYPETIQLTSIVTLVGGTVGGYITFAGAHRFLEDKNQNYTLAEVRKSAISGIIITAIMRILLFAAVLGVVVSGYQLNPSNPAASVFEGAAGKTGYFIFGIVLWAASITSVVGSAFTSISFLKTLHPFFTQKGKSATIVFLLISTIIFCWWGKPVLILVLAGALNGIILPFALALMLWVLQKKQLPAQSHPGWLIWSGWLVVAIMTWMSILTFIAEFPKLFS